MQILEKKKGRDCVKPLYRTILFTIIFVLSYCIVFLFDETRDRSGSACGSDRRAIHSEFCDLYGAGEGG